MASGGKIMKAASSVARAAMSGEGGTPEGRYDIQHRYYTGGPITSRGSSSQEIGQIAHRKVFQSGVAQDAPRALSSPVFQTQRDYSPMNFSMMRGGNTARPGGSQAVGAESSLGAAQGSDLEEHTSWAFARQRPGYGRVAGRIDGAAGGAAIGAAPPALIPGTIPAAPVFGALGTGEVPALGAGSVGAIGGAPIEWNGQSKVRGRKRPGAGQLSLFPDE